MPRVPALQLPHHVGFGRDQELRRLLVPRDVLNHRLRAAGEVREVEDVLRALRVRDRHRLRVLLLLLDEVRHAEDLVNHARPVPQDHVAAGDLLHVAAEVLVRHEQDFVARRHLVPHHVLRVPARHDPIAERLHLRGTVDVGHRLERAAVGAEPLLVALQFVRRARVHEAAPGLEVGQQHRLRRVQHLGGFGHEEHAAEHDHRRIDLGGLAGELQAVAGDVGERLDLALLVVVGQDGGPELLLEVENFGGHVVENSRHDRLLVFTVAEGQPTGFSF